MKKSVIGILVMLSVISMAQGALEIDSYCEDGVEFSNIVCNADGMELDCSYDAVTCTYGCEGDVCATCTDMDWTPDKDNYCSDTEFQQTSNCGNTRTVFGTKEPVCAVPEDVMCGEQIVSENECSGCGVGIYCETGTCVEGTCTESIFEETVFKITGTCSSYVSKYRPAIFYMKLWSPMYPSGQYYWYGERYIRDLEAEKSIEVTSRTATGNITHTPDEKGWWNLQLTIKDYYGNTCYRNSGGTYVGLCGDGILDRGEECDDSNTLNGDGCNKICEIE
jgi:cysteine-rich repeat protein